jgi:hypothetical protein
MSGSVKRNSRCDQNPMTRSMLAEHTALVSTKETIEFELQPQTQRSRSKKHQTSECFVSKFPSQVREITSPYKDP